MSYQPKISGSTRLLGVIGSPIQHSLSPCLHNYVIYKKSLDFVYIPVEVQKNQIYQWFPSFQVSPNFIGLNITIPFKESLFDLVDYTSSVAQQVGAINVLNKIDGQVKGDNTDVYGVLYSIMPSIFRQVMSEQTFLYDNLLDDQVSLVDIQKGDKLTCFLLGCGGASRSVCVALGLLQKYISCSIDLICLSRPQSLDKANRMTSHIASFFPSLKFSHVSCLDVDYSQWIGEGKYLFVNSSPLGLKEGDLFPFDIQAMPYEILSKASFFDLVYHPSQTKFVRFLHNKQIKAKDGLDMLLMQAALSFSLWTNEEVGSVFLDMKESLLKRRVDF